jgi:hypothetical protein
VVIMKKFAKFLLTIKILQKMIILFITYINILYISQDIYSYNVKQGNPSD